MDTVPRPSWSSAAAISASPSSARLRMASCKLTSAVRNWAWVNPRAPAAPRKRCGDGGRDPAQHDVLVIPAPAALALGGPEDILARRQRRP